MPLALLPDLPALDTFGAPKTDFGESIDPSSEVSASNINAMAATIAALARSAPKVWVVVNSTGALVAYDGVWGNAAGAYAPVSAKTGTGVYTVTFPSQVPDLLDGTLRAFAPKGAKAGSNTALRAVSSTVIAGNVITVTLPSGDGGFTMEVYA